MILRKLVFLALAAFAVAGCASNPATGSKDVVFTSSKSEQERARRYHEQILRFYGLYDDQALQDYVQEVGDRVAKNSHLGDWDFEFVVVDDESVNAFTTGGRYIYVHRGLLAHLNSEAELAAVLGHEIGHVTARHPAKRQTQGILASVLATGAAIATGSSAIAQLANIGATAWLQGYGRDNEMEADRLGLQYSAKSGYRPEAMVGTFNVFKAQEAFERQRAKTEGREPRIYHGIFSSHPAPDSRVIQAAKGSANIETEPEGGWIDNRDQFMKAIDGLPYGSSRAQGIVRDNRFYHAAMRISMAFPKGWTIENQRDRLIAFTKNKDSLLQVTIEGRPDTKAPREFLLEKLRGGKITHGEALSVNGMNGYTVITRNGSPLDGGAGPVRWAVLYQDRVDEQGVPQKSAYVFGAASRSAANGVPADDGLYLSVMQTLRDLKPSEFPLAEPYRIRVVEYESQKTLDELAKTLPLDKYKKEELELLNGLYPNKKPEPGSYIKVVE
jgi:predicted Zn-dependent protease